jgi:lia operon protein LiaF
MKRPFLTVFFFVGLGATLLCLNLGIFDLGETSWSKLIIPGIFLIVGASSLDSYTKKRRDGMSLLWGLFCFTFGTLVTLGILELFEFSYSDWLKLWPILIVAFGLHKLFKKPVKKIKGTMSFETEKKIEKRSFHSPEWTLEPIDLHKKVADYYFDFSKAIIPPGETPIQLTGYVGNIHMLIPENLAVHITVKGSVGDVELFDKKDNGLHTNLVFQSPTFEEADKRLRIYIEFNVVDVKIQGV